MGIRKKPVESNMYYCKSRYYVPEWCRFTSPDSIEYLDPNNINGMNLYAYCSNDPVNKIDPMGYFAVLGVDWLNLSNIFDLFSATLQGIIGLGMISSYMCVKNVIRPNNIGLGIWVKKQNKTLKGIENEATKLNKASKILAAITVVIQVGEGIYRDIQRNYSIDRIISNTIINSTIYAGTMWAAGAVGGKIGSIIGSFCPIPIVGTVAGTAIGYLVGVGLGFLLNMDISGKSLLDHIGDGFYSFWKNIFK